MIVEFDSELFDLTVDLYQKGLQNKNHKRAINKQKWDVINNKVKALKN